MRAQAQARGRAGMCECERRRERVRVCVCVRTIECGTCPIDADAIDGGGGAIGTSCIDAVTGPISPGRVELCHARVNLAHVAQSWDTVAHLEKVDYRYLLAFWRGGALACFVLLNSVFTRLRGHMGEHNIVQPIIDKYVRGYARMHGNG